MEANPVDPGIGFIAKYLYRRRVMTERIATLVVQSVHATGYAEDAPWLLGPVVRSISKFPWLADDVLSALEAVMRRLSGDDRPVNSRSEFDGLLEFFARCEAYRLGIPAARLDDAIIAWLDHPQSLAAECAQGSYFPGLVARILSIAYSGRLASGYRDDLLTRLRAWIPHWRCAWNDGNRTHALELLSQAEAIFRDSTDRSQAPAARGEDSPRSLIHG
jgi:hypothetical protein